MDNNENVYICKKNLQLFCIFEYLYFFTLSKDFKNNKLMLFFIYFYLNTHCIHFLYLNISKLKRKLEIK